MKRFQKTVGSKAPEDLRLATDMFVAEIAGHSMEPLHSRRIAMRVPVRRGGSRTGRLVLVEQLDCRR